jgi:DNA helicase IV
MYLSESFPYQHIIIDEGQDFGMDAIEESEILRLLKDIVTDTSSRSGTFYVFYDKLQLVQARRMPKFIEDADCKLTLYRNCRNTENIAITSLRPLSERKPRLYDGCVKGVPANFHFSEDESSIISCLNDTLEQLRSEGFKDIVILTCKTEETSILKNQITNQLYLQKYRFTTCRKFKGLEADVVILVDVDGSTFNSENVLLYYVGSSRARIRLEIITELTDDECTDILIHALDFKGKIKKPKRDLSAALNALGHIVK